jgi:hypothetical protein
MVPRGKLLAKANHAATLRARNGGQLTCVALVVNLRAVIETGQHTNGA